MTNVQQNQIQSKPKVGIAALKDMINNDVVKRQFQYVLKDEAAGFITSVISVCQNNALLSKADAKSVILAASAAATLKLPINPNLGLAALVPFNDKRSGLCLCQMIVMRNGWVELAQRTGQVVRIANEPVYEGELVKANRFTDEYEFDETKRVSDKIIGYMAYVKLTNGFEKTVYWTVEKCKQHGLRYSQTFKQGYGLWVDDFNSQALKTVLKHLIVKYLPKSIELQNAAANDQASFSGDIDNPKVEYLDRPNADEQEEKTDFQEAEIVVEPTEEELAEQNGQAPSEEQAEEPAPNGELDLK
jgi:recombination protein RecT